MKKRIEHILVWIKLLRLLLRGVSLTTAKRFAHWSGGGNTQLVKKFKIANKAVIYEPLNVSLPLTVLDFSNQSLPLLEEIFTKYKAICIDNNVVLTKKSFDTEVRCNISSWPSFTVFLEIMQEEIYGFALNDKCIVLDVGMNVGIAALYFAAHPNVEQVYGYEIVQDNYEKSLGNFQLNSALKGKVTPCLFGLSAQDGFIELQDFESGTIEASIVGLKVNSARSNKTNTVEIKAADKELSQIISSNAGKSIIIKLDCEGSEYEIIELLSQTDLLRHIKGFIIEWHQHGPHTILNTLVSNGFMCSYQHHKFYPDTLGMIYAWK